MRAPVLAWVCWVAGLLLAATPGRAGERAMQRPTDFELRAVDGANPGATRGAVALIRASLRPEFVGTYIAGDATVGEFLSNSVPIAAPIIYLPLAGYPTLPGNRLEVEILDGQNGVVRTLVCDAANPGERPHVWRLPGEFSTAARLRVRLIDRTTARFGWLGVGAPVFLGESVEPAWLERRLFARESSWWRFAFGLAAMLIVIWGPGLWWSRHGGDPVARLALAPVWGMVSLAVVGAGLWIARAAKTPGAEWGLTLWLLGSAAGAGWACWRRWGREAVAWRIGGIYLALVAAAQFYWLTPAPVAAERWSESVFRGRIVAAPPDMVIPFFTAAYMHHGKNGREDRASYFGVEWAITSRGPLVPLMLNAALTLCRVHPHDPIGIPEEEWPADEAGFFVSRIMGAVTNALVVFGAVYLLGALGLRSPRSLVWGAALLAASPVALLHTVFLWPKLLAAYFGCLALADTLTGRPAWRIGAWLALAYGSHPVGGLLWPAVACAWAWRANGGLGGRWRSWLSFMARGAQVAGVTLAFLLPWLLYKIWVGHPELLFNYPFGDGREWLPAVSIRSWLQCRLDNFIITFVPFVHIRSDWARYVDGVTLAGWLRWPLHAEFTLAGGLGAAGFALAIYALATRATSQGAARLRWVIVGTVGVMLVYWGYNRGGLGRNCLEPATVLIAVLAADRANSLPWWLRVAGLALVALETGAVALIGFIAEPQFHASLLGAADWICFTGLGASLAAIVAFASWRPFSAASPDASDPCPRLEPRRFS